jgi:hyperosmotically inducible periplasmic protein
MMRQKFFAFLGVVAVAATMTAACSKSDSGITTAVKTKFASDDTVKATDINVDTKDKVVTLRGEVQSSAAKVRAVEIARATDGVRDVVDVLVVTPGPAATSGVADSARDSARESGEIVGDAAITTAVKTKMLADTTVGGLKIDVDTKNGVVSLSGDVASAVEKRKAVAIAKETDGVKSVNDRLKIVKE